MNLTETDQNNFTLFVSDLFDVVYEQDAFEWVVEFSGAAYTVVIINNFHFP